VTDDNNKPLSENLGKPAQKKESIFETSWGHCGIFPRKIATNSVNAAQTLNVDVDDSSLIELFESFFMKDYIINTLIPNINKKIEGKAVTYGEFLQCMDLWLLMSSSIGLLRRSFFFEKIISSFVTVLMTINTSIGASKTPSKGSHQ
jgi:hypothetical protein